MSRRLIVWILLCVGAVIILWSLINGWNDIARMLPWTAQHRAASAEAKAATATSDATARGLEVQGAEAQAQRVDTFHHEIITVQTAAAAAVVEARSAPDANEPLPADRAERLGRLDGIVCASRPGLCAPSQAQPAE